LISHFQFEELHMKLKTLTIALATAAVLAATGAHADVLTNAGFETGDLTGWTAAASNTQPGSTGGVAVVTSTNDFFFNPYLPTQGNFFAVLTAGDQSAYTTLSQTFTISTRSLVTGDTAFLGSDVLPNNDDGYVKLIGANGARTLFAASIASVGAFASTGWTGFGAIVDPGTYTLQFGVENIGDNQLSSQVLADNINVSAVPEASTWAMVLVGFAGLGLMARRRKAGATLLEA
jgi:MYXO-CTERM domain-containing protein